MALLLYSATVALLLWLCHRYVRPLSWAAAVVLLALPLGLTGRALLTDSVYGPIDYLYQDEPLKSLAPGIGPTRNASATDVISEFFPWRHAVRESLRRGEWPLWNAYNLAGHPLAAEAQSAPYSPFTLLACLLPSAVSLSYTAALAFFIAGLSAFLLARELGCSEAASLFAAAGWALASSIVLYSLTAMGFATVYLPLILAATRRVVREPGLAAAMFLTAALSLCMLSGHPESLFLNVLVGCAFGLFALLRIRVAPWRAIGTAIAAGVVTLGLCAIFLLPLIEAIPQSAEFQSKEAWKPWSRGAATERVLAALATNFFPHLHVRQWLVPKLDLINVETAAVGSIILALAVYAISRRRTAETWFFTVLSLVCIVIGARWTPLAVAIQKIPLLHVTLYERLVFAGALGLSILAAFGVDELLRRDDRRAAAATFAAVFAFLGAGMLWLAHYVQLSAVPGGYGRYRIFAELFFLGTASLLLVLPLPMRKLVPALLALLFAQRVLSEIDTFDTWPASAAYPPLALFQPLQHIDEPFRIVGVGGAFPPATNISYGLEDVRGYEALTLDEYKSTWRLWNHPHGLWFHRVDDLTAPMLSFLNVRFAIQPRTLPVPPGWRVVNAQGASVLLENSAVLPRISIPRQVMLGALSNPETIDRMAQARDFRAMAWITSAGDLEERANGPGRIHLRSRSLGGDYRFDAAMDRAGWVVLSDSAWKGWRAFIDGRRVPLARANAGFLAVFVPAGTHQVRVVYHPTSFVRGRAITFATILVLVGLLIFRRCFPRHRAR
jgi:hypothetical protein